MSHDHFNIMWGQNLPNNPYTGQQGLPQQLYQQQAYYAPQPGYPAYPPQPQPNLSGGYNPYPLAQQAYNPAVAYPSYGQSLFRPQATPEGYHYSSAYTAQPPDVVAPLPGYEAPGGPPAKRQRPNPTADAGPTWNGAWRNCQVSGCKFVGSAKDVEVHEEDRHLIYKEGYKVQRSEEEERFARRKG